MKEFTRVFVTNKVFLVSFNNMLPVQFPVCAQQLCRSKMMTARTINCSTKAIYGIVCETDHFDAQCNVLSHKNFLLLANCWYTMLYESDGSATEVRRNVVLLANCWYL